MKLRISTKSRAEGDVLFECKSQKSLTWLKRPVNRAWELEAGFSLNAS